jgi:hypothetical protein
MGNGAGSRRPRDISAGSTRWRVWGEAGGRRFRDAGTGPTGSMGGLHREARFANEDGVADGRGLRGAGLREGEPGTREDGGGTAMRDCVAAPGVGRGWALAEGPPLRCQAEAW